MPHRRRHQLRNALSGLLVLIVLVLPVTRANAALPPATSLAAVATAFNAARAEPRHRTGTSSSDERSKLPCPGHVESPWHSPGHFPGQAHWQADGLLHADGVDCCPACGCSFAAGALPSAPAMPRSADGAAVGFPPPSESLLDDFSSAPILPPPRPGV